MRSFSPKLEPRTQNDTSGMNAAVRTPESSKPSSEPVQEDAYTHRLQREVFACISDLADHLFGYDEERYYASYDDFENSMINTCPNCEHCIKDIDGLEEDDDGSSICPNCGQPIDYFEPRIPEILEYWIVSPFLGKMLSDHGECVLRRSDGWIWGRCCSGQAIALDYVIEKICEELDLFTDK